MASTLQESVGRLSGKLGLQRDWYLVIVAAVIGVLMGAVAMAFIWPLRQIEEWSVHPETSRTLLFVLVLLAPAAGGLLAGVAVHLIMPRGRGPGVSAVIYAVHRSKSVLPLRVGVRKWIASTLTIGSGGSAGAEGPIVTIGATLGSNLGRWLNANPQTTATLLGCGAAAGIASVFNAPIAGIFFVLEILLRDFSLRTFTPIVIASVISAAWTQTILGGNEPLFGVSPEFFPQHEFFTVFEVPNFFMLGLVCGVVAPLFVRSLFWTDELFGRVKIKPMFKPALGGAALGALGLLYVLFVADEVPKFYGNGYPIIKEFLDPATYFNDPASPELKAVGGLLLLLVSVAVAKAIGTCLTIGSGGAGGLFAPSLLIGSGVGGAFGVVVYMLDWFPAASPAHYALVGMAAMVAATTHAPLTGIIIVYEITRSEEIILPIMLAAVISVVAARLISHDSVYTWKPAWAFASGS